MMRTLVAAGLAVLTSAAGVVCAGFREEAPGDELRRLRADNKALREQNEAFAAKLGLPATVVVPATRPVAPSGDAAVGMSLDAVRAIAERDGLRLERVEPAPNGIPAAAETWRLAKVVDVFVPPPGTIERRFNAGSDQGKVKERTEWAKLVRMTDGRVVRIDPVIE